MTSELDFAPMMRPMAAEVIGAHRALEIRNRRSFAEAVAGRWVQLDYDERPLLLDELAADPAVREALIAVKQPAGRGPDQVTPPRKGPGSRTVRGRVAWLRGGRGRRLQRLDRSARRARTRALG